MSEHIITVTSASGIEGVTAKELKGLGIENPKAIDGSFTFDGSELTIARLNMFLRTGARVYIKAGEFFADTFDQLFDGTQNIPWEKYLNQNSKIIVNGKSKKSQLFALSSCQSIIKKAILCRLSDKFHTDIFSEDGSLFQIDFSINEDNVTMLINTSGAGLHKRGYRVLVGEAPIKETLACAMLLLSDMNGERPFIDPFCGSGTILLEAARIALNIASGKLRNFDYQSWEFFDKTAYDTALCEALDTETPKKLRFSGFDIDPKAISLAQKHAALAGLSDKVHIQVQDVSKLSSRYKNGCIVTNPPYGERLLDLRKVNELYKTLGEVYRSLDNWSLFLITSSPQFEKYFKQRSHKNRKLYNAGMECRFYQYLSQNNLQNQ